MRVTLQDIAKRAGVHKSSVSLVLGNKPLSSRMADATKRRIFAAAEELNYRPNLLARSLCDGKTNTLGLVCGDIHTPHFAEFASVAMEISEQRGQQLLISATRWDVERELKCIEMLIQRGVDGIMLYCGALTPETELYKRVMQHGYPVVTMEAQTPGLPFVCTDYTEGMQQAIGLLKKIGHTSAGYLGPTGESMYVNSKPDTFRVMCEKYGLASSFYQCERGAGPSENMGFTVAGEERRPNAFIVYSDFCANSFIRGLRKGGLEVPRDIDIISVDATQWGKNQSFILTSITRDREKMATHAIDLLLRQRDEGVLPQDNRGFFCPSSLVVGESTKSLHDEDTV